MTNTVENTSSSITESLDCALDTHLTQGQRLVEDLLDWLLKDGVQFAVNFVVALLILIAGIFVVKGITAAVRKSLQKTKRVNDLLEKFICSVVNKSGWAVLLMIVFQQLGVNVGPLIAGLGVTGFILGFAFQESLGNLASGIMIALNQPFKVGDYIIAGGVEGSVLELNMMATVLATADNKRVTIPNKSVWGGAITNFSALGIRRVDTVIGIDYGTDIAKAKTIAMNALLKLPGVLQDPQPTVEILSLADSSVVLAVRPWSTCADYWNVFFGAQQTVKQAFDENGISIPFPQLVIHSNK